LSRQPNSEGQNQDQEPQGKGPILYQQYFEETKEDSLGNFQNASLIRALGEENLVGRRVAEIVGKYRPPISSL
jgi:hypothetical protein